MLEKNQLASLFLSRNDKTSVQFIKYIFVGGLAYGADFAALLFFTEVCGLFYLVSAALGFLIGLGVNYVLSICWVFSKRSASNGRLEFMVFALIGLVGLALNEAIIWFFTEAVHFHYLLSKVVSTIIVFIWNFSARKKILFS